MADPSRQRNVSGARDNPSRRRSANERHESDNEANPMNTNNNTRRNPNDDSPSPDSQVVTSTTPEDLDTSHGTVLVQARESSEATPPSSVESPSLEEDLPREDSPSSLEVTSTSNINVPYPATNPPPILQGIAGMSIDESGLDFRSNAFQEASPSRRIRSVIQESQRSRQDQNRSFNLSLQNRAVGAERRNTESEETVLSSICRRLLDNARTNTSSRPHVLQTQPSSSMSLREHLTTTSRQNVGPTIHHSTRLPTLVQKETSSGTNFQESTASNLPPMSIAVTTYYPAVMNPPSYASIYSSPRPKPFVPSSENRPNSSLTTSPNVSTKQPVQSLLPRPPPFIPSNKSKTQSLVPTTSTRPQSPMPFSAKRPSTKEPTTTTIPMSATTSSFSLVQSSTTTTLSTSSAFSNNRPIEPGSLMWHLAPQSCQSTRHPALEEALAFSPSSRLPETSSSPTLSAPVLGSLMRPLAPSSGSSSTPSTPALGSLMRPLVPASKSPTRHTSVPESIASTRFPVYIRPSVPDFNSPMSSKHSASSKPSVSRTSDQKIVVPTSTDFMPSDYAHRSTQSSHITSLPRSKSKSSKIPKPLNLINVPNSLFNTSDNNEKGIKCPTKSALEKSPTKRLANTSSEGTSNGSNNTDNNLSPTKKLKIAFRVGEGSNLSEEDDSSGSAAEVKSDVMDDEDSAPEIPSPRKKCDPKDENSF